MQAEDWTRNTTKEFVAWIRKNPTYYEKKVRDSKGKVVETIRRPRSYTDASINRVLDDVRAAFRFCMDRPPVIQGIQRVVPREGRKKPTLSVQQVKDLFAYAYASEDRKHLQNYLLIAFTTLARPEAIIDISVAAERGQVEWDYRLLHLNPEGRQQTKKHRPSIPINDYLLPVIQECHNEYLVHKADPENTPKHSGFLVQYRGKPIASIRQTWNRAKKALGWPMGGSIGRDWDAKMIRHTMSKWLRAQGAPWPEIEGQMGHRIDSQTAAYAEYEPDYLGRVQAEITRYMSQIFEGQNWACTPLAPHLEKNVVSIKAKKGDKSSG
jgi:integrase